MNELKKPNFIIVGSAKCGTTTLAKIMDSHEEVCMGRPKEVSFFQDTIDFKLNANYAKGWSWYQHSFLHYKGEKMVGEATPSYSDRSRSPNTAQRIYDFNPEMKIIYMVRNPVKRQISAWKMQFASSQNVKKDSEFWKVEYDWASKGLSYWLKKQQEVGQWDTCKFYYQIEAYKNIFPESNVCVTFLEDWKLGQISEIKRIFKFLNINTGLKDDFFLRKENTLNQRKKTSSFFKFLKSVAVKLNLSKLASSQMKTNITDKFSKQISYPDFNIGDLNEFVDYVKEDSELFLKKYGKNTSFWNFKEI